jgi:CheY-like chemotaxis protein
MINVRRSGLSMIVPHSSVILLIDDSADDRFLLRRTFEKAGIINPIQDASSGREAIEYLNGEGRFGNRAAYPFPGILFVDLNMPGVDGFDVLEWVRNKLEVRGVLIIVLSRLDELKQVNRAYTLGANSFLTKPGEERELEGLIRAFKDYWLLKNKAPEIRAGST